MMTLQRMTITGIASKAAIVLFDFALDEGYDAIPAISDPSGTWQRTRKSLL